MEFSKNLKRIRKSSGYTAKELAQKLELPYTTYVAYENQGREPKFDTLMKIADILHVSVDELLGYEVNDHGINFNEFGKALEILRKGKIKTAAAAPPGMVAIYIIPSWVNQMDSRIMSALERHPVAIPQDGIIEICKSAVKEFENKETFQAELHKLLVKHASRWILEQKIKAEVEESGPQAIGKFYYAIENGQLVSTPLEDIKLINGEMIAILEDGRQVPISSYESSFKK